VAVRPSDVEICACGPDGPQGAGGTVARAHFLGDEAHYEIALADDVRLAVKSTTGADVLDVGTAVGVRLKPDAATVLVSTAGPEPAKPTEERVAHV
jgi:hypothetical protein